MEKECVREFRHCLEEAVVADQAGEEEEVQEVQVNEEHKEAEEHFEGLDGEEDQVKPWEALVYYCEKAFVNDGRGTDGLIIVLVSSTVDNADLEDLEESLEDLDMFEETIYHSGPFD